MNWFKSVWMRLRKSNNLPGNEVLVPITDLPSGTQVTVTIPQKPKRIIVRKKKDVNNT